MKAEGASGLCARPLRDAFQMVLCYYASILIITDVSVRWNKKTYDIVRATIDSTDRVFHGMKLSLILMSAGVQALRLSLGVFWKTLEGLGTSM